MIVAVILLAVLAVISALAFWRPNPVLFMIAAGISMMSGLNAPDTLSSVATTTTNDITIGMSLVAYAFLCLAFSIKVMFWQETAEDDED